MIRDPQEIKNEKQLNDPATSNNPQVRPDGSVLLLTRHACKENVSNRTLLVAHSLSALHQQESNNEKQLKDPAQKPK